MSQLPKLKKTVKLPSKGGKSDKGAKSPVKPAKLTPEQKWKADLKEYLRNDLLPRAIANDSALDKMVSDENMEIWATAYTSEDYDPDVGKNWEELELLGDRLLSYLFAKYMMESYPTANRGQISVLITVYLAKPFLAQLSAKYGMSNHILSRFRNTIHMMEDVFESTFGALVKTGDTIKNGVGVGLAYNLFVSIFDDVEIDWTLARGNPKTQVKEAFEAMGWIRPKKPYNESVPEKVEERDGQTLFQVLLNQKAVDQLAELGIKVSTNILGQAQESTKKKASDAAYVQALESLETMGLTYDWIRQVREQRQLENPELAEYFPLLEKKLAKEGYVKFYFREERAKTSYGEKSKNVYVQLIGVKEDGSKKILAMTEDPAENSLAGKKQVLQEWTQ